MRPAGNNGISEAVRAEGYARLAAGIRAGIYTRMSLARMDDKTKVEDQDLISREMCERRGWEVAASYCDNNKSAWQLNRKRPGWNQMLADVKAGKINAIVVYHGDRLIRQPRDLEDLIDLARSSGIALASPTGTRDLGNPDDQFILRIEAAQACRESDNTSRRRKQQYERWRREGRTRPGGPGGRSYGFATDGLTQIPAECEHIRQMAAMLLDGGTTGSLVRDAAERGLLTPSGKPFSHHTLRRMLARPRYAGLMPDGENTAAWEPVLDREIWERVREALEVKRVTFTYATNARRWLLSGIAVCGMPGCGAAVQLRPSQGRGRAEYTNGYGCPSCRKVYRSAPLLDAYVIQRTVHRLNDPRNPAPDMPAEPGHAAEWAKLQEERAATERQAKDYRTSAGRLDILMARLDSIDARMAELREREAGDARSRLLAAHQGITVAEFKGQPLAVQRALVAACFRITVLPASKRGPGFRTEDVDLAPL